MAEKAGLMDWMIRSALTIMIACWLDSATLEASSRAWRDCCSRWLCSCRAARSSATYSCSTLSRMSA